MRGLIALTVTSNFLVHRANGESVESATIDNMFVMEKWIALLHGVETDCIIVLEAFKNSLPKGSTLPRSQAAWE